MLRKLILGILLNTIAFYAVTEIVQDITFEGGLAFLIVSGLLLGFINAFIKPIIKVFSFPVIFLSGGLFLIVINAGVLFVLKHLYEIIEVESFALIVEGGALTYLYGGAVFGVINWLEHWLVKK